MRRHLVAWTLGACVCATALLAGCADGPADLARQLTQQENYRPPESASVDSARYLPTLYLRVNADTQLVGMVNPDPMQSLDDAPEESPQNLIRQLRFARDILQKNRADSLMVPQDVNLVLDRGMRADAVMAAILIASNGKFSVPHLITAEGYQHVLEPPRMVQGTPFGWSAWVWLQPDMSFRWAVAPDTSEGLSLATVPSDGGDMDLGALVAVLRETLDARDYIPPGPDRLIGMWVDDPLPYPELMRLMDGLRYPPDGAPVTGRLTMLLGTPWAAPPDSVLGG